MFAPALLSMCAAPDERTFPSMTGAPPTEQWIAIGSADVDTDYSRNGYDGDRAHAFSFVAGAWWWGESFGSAGEAEIASSHHSVTAAGITDDLQTWNLRVGGRIGWRGLAEQLVVFGRGGVEWRADNGDHVTAISDEGFGVYGGVGMEWRLGPHAGLSPDLTWSVADVNGNSSQTAVGLALVIRF